MPRTIAVIGAGNIGTTLALVLAKQRRVTLQCIEPEVMEEINARGENSKYLKGVKLPRSIKAVATAAEALEGAEAVFLAVPSGALKTVTEEIAPLVDKAAIVACITKGLDPEKLIPMSLAARDKLGAAQRKTFCVIGGPAIAGEIAQGKPAALLVASESGPAARNVADLLQGEVLKVGTSRDLTGVAYVMTFKNAYAIALGMCQGLEYPMNTRAMAMTLALQEIAQFLQKAGGRPETAYSLAGLGDLLATGLSGHSRNRTYGELLVGARTSEPKELGLTTVEGIGIARIALKLAAKRKIKTPLLEAIVECLDSRMHFERPFVKFLTHLKLD